MALLIDNFKACTHNIAKPWSTRVEDIKRTSL